MSKVLELKFGQIKFSWRARLDVGDLSDLVSSIGRLGQLQPIIVSQVDGAYELIAGARRIAACKQLQRGIKAVVASPDDEAMALDMQIDENRARKDFDRYELARAIQRRKELYEVEHPSTKKGATGRGRPKPKDAPLAFAEVYAKRIGISSRGLTEYVQIANLPAKQRKEIEDTKSAVERNKLVHSALQQIRNDGRQAQLKADAERRQKDREQLKLDENEPPPIHVYHGDYREVLAKLPDESVDLICTDPPYDRERSIVSHAVRASINPFTHKWDKLDVGWVLDATPKLVQGGTLLAFCPLEAIGAYELAFEAAELTYRMTILWCKSNPGPAHRPTYVSAVEAIVWAVKPGKTPFFKPWEGKSTHGDYHPMNWIEGPIAQGKQRLHPTQKPNWLIHKLLDRHSSADLGHRVLDPFAGSGTTGVVCRQREQTAILIEKDDKYVEMIRTRLQAL